MTWRSSTSSGGRSNGLINVTKAIWSRWGSTFTGRASWPETRYECQVPGDSVIALHQLCDRCTKLINESSLVRRLAEGKDIRTDACETVDLWTAEQLNSSRLGSCHLCSLIWRFCMGDKPGSDYPSRPYVPTERITVKLEVTGPGKVPQGETLRPWASVEEQSVYVVMYIQAVRHHEDRIKKVRDRSEIYIFPPSHQQLKQAQFHRDSISVSSKHEDGLDQIKAWLQDCLSNHPKCRGFHSLVAPNLEMPSRLLDLDGGKVKLDCNASILTNIKYATLSHSWGKDPSLCLSLKKSLVQEFQREIPEAQLPDKYLDAIRIARYLGYRYLWIDSLCIIQDSTEDWEKEALKMASVYGRTDCNISYIHPPLEEDKKHFLRDPRTSLPCKIWPTSQPGREGLDSSGSKYLLIQNVMGRLAKSWAYTTQEDLFPLASRGWVFQERLLCPRNIYYGGPRLLWECCEGIEDELYGQVTHTSGSPTKSDYYSIFSGIEEVRRGLDQFETFNGQWYRLVQEYRLRDLTFEKDRAIAFAGIAKAIQRHTKFTYLAGIWKEFAELQLLWTVDYSPLTRKVCGKGWKRDSVKAPSWSWFSIPRTPEPLSERDTVTFQSTIEMYTQLQYATYRAEVISFHHPKLTTMPTPNSEVPLHGFEGLRITLRTRRVPATMEWDEDMIRILPYGRHDLGEDVVNPKSAMSYLHDDVATSPGCPLPTNASMLLILMEAWQWRDRKERKYEPPSSGAYDTQASGRTMWQYAGLLVVPAGKGSNGTNVWRRIGCFIFGDRRNCLTQLNTPFSRDGVGDEEVVLV